jgi:hypothetical protein
MALTNERIDELIGKLEVATTDGDLPSLTQDDIGDIYSWMLAQRSRAMSDKCAREYCGHSRQYHFGCFGWDCTCPEFVEAGEPETQDMLNERSQLRLEQINRVMPCVGPLLDAWEGTPNDFKSEILDQYLRLHNALVAVYRAMEEE